jgi:RNA recognition motif-containing protein
VKTNTFIMKIFVARLPYAYQESDIAALFAPYGEVATVNLIMDRETGRSKCYAFVEMPNEGEASTAISSLDQKEINRKQIAVSPAQERPKTGGSPAGNGYNRNTYRNESGTDGGYQQRSNSNYDNNRKTNYSRDRDKYNDDYKRDNKFESDY